MKKIMNQSRWMLFVTLLMPAAIFAQQSQWVHPGPDGKLVYKTTDAGDRIMDFSGAGYMGGGVAIPEVPVVVTVQPSGGEDDTAAIQSAVDQVGKMPLKDGFRGAVLLAAGKFTCKSTIHLPVSGVVLRGSGADQTTLFMTGTRHAAISIGPDRGSREGRAPTDDVPDNEPDAKQTFTEAHTTIADAYVASGADHFSVADAKGFAAGDLITISRPTTPAWVHLMNMDTLTRGGKPQTWIANTRHELAQRTIATVNGNVIMLDVPLADSYDAKYLGQTGTTVSKIRSGAPVTKVGVEHLRIQCPPLETSYGQAPYSAVHISGDDCWVRDLNCEETMNSTVLGGHRITMEKIVVTHTYPNLGASKPTDFSIEGSQILIDRCKVTGDNEYFVWTGSLEAGPNVILNSVFSGHGSRIQPHQRWSTGLLVDNCTVPDGGIDFANRGAAGSGHGWTMGWATAWNCIASTYVIQQPPGAMNWAIGCIGSRVQTARYFDSSPILPEGEFESHGNPVTPQSLYLAQLSDRLGEKALANIGYASNSPDQMAGKDTPKLPPLKIDVDPVLGADLAMHRPMNASNVRDNAREFGAEKAVDGDDKTYWATDAGGDRITLEADMEGPVEINAVQLCEPPDVQHVKSYKVEGVVNSDYQLLSQGTTIGPNKVDHFAKATVWKVRITIVSDDYAALSKFGLYLDRNSPATKP